jgi:hypothetical protein
MGTDCIVVLTGALGVGECVRIADKMTRLHQNISRGHFKSAGTRSPEWGGAAGGVEDVEIVQVAVEVLCCDVKKVQLLVPLLN